MDRFVSARNNMRVVDMPEFYGGGYDLISGRRTSMPKIAQSPWAFACMNIRGQELANIPWHIKRNDKILDKHPLIDMLEDFGPESNYQRGMLYTEIDMLLYGAALWLRDVDTLRRLDPSTIEVRRNSDGISGFKQTIYKPDGKVQVNEFSRDEVIYFREYHPDDDLGYGVSASDVCKRLINAEVEALLMIEALYKNDAVPGLFLSSEQDITEKEANRLIDWWNKRFRGGRNKGKVGIAGKGLKPTPVGSNMKDAMVMELLDGVHNDICVAMRVPKVLVGSQIEATYVNLSESRKFLIEDVMIPRCIEYQNVINQDLVNKVDPGVEFEFAFDEMQILQEDSTQKSTRLLMAYNAGLITDDYYREEMGYPQDSKPEEEPDKQQVAEDKMEKKATKAFMKGDSPAVDFQSDYIPIDRMFVLKGRLQNADSVEAVRACFD